MRRSPHDQGRNAHRDQEGQVKAEHPSTNHVEFVMSILAEIARCLNMPFNIASGNSAGYNYASGRLDHQSFFKAIRIDQSHLADIVLDRIFRAWINEAVLVEGLLPQPVAHDLKPTGFSR